MKFWIFIFFTLGSFAAKASAAHEKMVDEPRACWKTQTFPCAVRAIKNKVQFDNAQGIYHLSKNTSLLFKSGKDFELLEGYAWVETKAEIQVSTALWQAHVQGEFWVQRNGKRVLIRNLSGQLHLLSSQVAFHEEIPVGFENWYEGLNDEGVLYRGTLRPIALKDFVVHWFKVFSGSKTQAVQKMSEYKSYWSGSVQASGELYQKVILRRMASVQDSELKHQQKKAAVLREQEEFKKMFRNRNGL